MANAGGKDFEVVKDMRIDFHPNATERVVMINIFDNMVYEGNKLFGVQLNLVSGVRTHISPSTVTVDITEDDQQPRMYCHFNPYCNGTSFLVMSIQRCCSELMGSSVSISADGGICQKCISVGFPSSSYTFHENKSEQHTLPILVNGGPLPVDIVIEVAAEEGSAVSKDFELLNTHEDPLTTRVMLTRNNARSSVLLKILPDGLPSDSRDKQSEVFGLRLKDILNLVPPNVIFNNSVVHILDVVPKIFMESRVYAVSENIGAVNIGVSTNGQHLSPITFAVLFTNESAQVGLDYLARKSRYSIEPQQRSININIDIREDNDFEGTEYFNVILQDIKGAVPEPEVVYAQVQIIDDDSITIGFEQTLYSVGEDGGSIEVCAAIRAGTLQTSAVVTMATVDDTAVAPGDYSRLSQSMTFHPDSLRQCVAVAIINDATVEDVEWFSLTLTTPDNRVILLPRSTTVLIGSLDSLPDVTIGFEQTLYIVGEDGGSIEVCAAIRNGTLQTSVVVTMATADGTARAPSDYSRLSQSMTFHPDSLRQCVAVAIVDDATVEDVELFSLTLTTTDNRVILEPETATVLIGSLDTPTDVTIGFEQTMYSVREDVGSVEVCGVNRSMVLLSSTIVVRVSTADGSAIAPNDYSSKREDISIQPGFMRGCISVDISNDNVSERVEQFSIIATSEDSRLTLNPNTTTVFIHDDDIPAQMQFLNLNVTPDIKRVFLPPMDEGVSKAISPPGGFKIFDKHVSTFYVNANGIIFINSSSGVSSPTNFAMLPQGSTPFIAPYWFDNDPSSHGNVSYEIHPKSSPLLTQVSEYISNRESVQFTGNWMMVAYWLDVPELFSEDVRNTYQAVLVTDGVSSYAIFIYKCGLLKPGSMGHGHIGYYINTTVFEYHPLSGSIRSSEIACINQQQTPWSTLVYTLKRAPEFSCYPQLGCRGTPISGLASPKDCCSNINALSYNDASGCNVCERLLVGFAQTSYSVSENGSNVNVTIEIKQGAVTDREITILLLFSTQNGTARSGDDYVSTTHNFFLTSGGGVGSLVNVSIPIVDDNIAESVIEFFWANIALPASQQIVLSTNRTAVLIQDNDRVVIGFERTAYFVSESDRFATVTVRIEEGTVGMGETVILRFVTQDNNATDMTDYIGKSQEISFTSGESVGSKIDINITLLQDANVTEGLEVFYGRLTVLDTRIITNVFPRETEIYIMDDNINCSNLPAPTNGQVVQSGSIPASTATYTCNSGYRLDGDSSTICQESGEWSGTAPTCEPINCPDLAGPTNGQVVQSGSTPASTATYTCNSGYRLNGDSSRTCQDSGEWSGTAPTCEPKSTLEIGFVETTYSVAENVSTVTVTVAILQGIVEDVVVVQFNTQNGTANDISDYRATTETITFTSGQSVGTQRDITISIIDNNVVEDTESFFGILHTTSQNVMLSNQIEIFILDNDATAKEKLPVRFLKLGTTVGIVPVFLARENNAVSRAITPRGPFPIFNTQHQTFYVTVDGLIFINTTALRLFPTSFGSLPNTSTPSFISSFWLKGDIAVGRGNVSYEVHNTSTSLLRQVSDYVSRNQSVPFVGSWMIVAFWSEVPEMFVTGSPGHSHQCVLITDGTTSYALFVYECDLLQSGSFGAIGYYIRGITSLEHPDSNSLSSPDVDCSPRANNTLVYRLFA